MPLQVYSSALIFAPETSIIQKTFVDHIPRWFNIILKAENNWNAYRITLEGHSGSINAVAFLLDGQLVASASDNYTVWLWKTATSSCHSILKGHSDLINVVAFSPNGQHLQTNQGQISLSLPPSSIPSPQDKELPTLFTKGQWVMLE
ncbi:MAG: hypothetical protein M1839_001616 [Geoglossum umbratile]|nr:MAG: hypothetical protein M1839_001616 [Geoglossum umbratile]